MRIEFSPRVRWALCAYSLLAVLTWFCTSDNVSAQRYCSIPQTIGEAGELPGNGEARSLSRLTQRGDQGGAGLLLRRRDDLNEVERTGYLLSGLIALSPVKVRLRHPNFYHRAVNPSLLLSQK